MSSASRRPEGDAATAPCAVHSARAAEPLAGTATTARRWLLVEHTGVWGRDAVAESGLPDAVVERLQAWEGEEPGSRVLLVRRPGARRRREGPPAVLLAVTAEAGASLSRVALDRLEQLPGADLSAGEPVTGPLFLVCAHGRRDPCCARLGPPVYDALVEAAGAERVWQSSHQGGHRLAACVTVLPAGLHLGRVTAADAPEIAAAVADGRVPLRHYRGRTLYGARAQAAEVELRRLLGLEPVDDVRLLGEHGREVRFATPEGERVLSVDELEPLEIPVSCGKPPEPVTVLRAVLAGT